MNSLPYYTYDELINLEFQSIGQNVLLSRKASVYRPQSISLGDNCRIDDFCVLSAGEGGIFIGRYVHIAVMSILIGGGAITIDDYCNISGRVSIYSSNDDYSGEWMTGPVLPAEYTNIMSQDVSLKSHVIVGAGSVILPGVTIGQCSAVGALCLVNSSLAPYGIYAGIPAKRIKERSKRVETLQMEFEHRSIEGKK